MNFINLIEEIQKGKTEQFLLQNSVDIEYDLIEIYAKEKLDVEADIKFFNAEEITNEILINIDGVGYENVCPLNMLEDLVHDFMAVDSKTSSLEMISKVLSYLEKDA